MAMIEFMSDVDAEFISNAINAGSLLVLAFVVFVLMRGRKSRAAEVRARLLGHSWKFPMSQTDAAECIRYEIQRSRRYNRSFSIVMVDLNALDEATKTELYRREQFLESLIRRTDFGVFGYGEMTSIFVCPETDASGAQAFVGRIQLAAQDEFGRGTNCAYASFPEDAMTYEGLMEHAGGHLSRTATTLGTDKLST